MLMVMKKERGLYKYTRNCILCGIKYGTNYKNDNGQCRLCINKIHLRYHEGKKQKDMVQERWVASLRFL